VQASSLSLGQVHRCEHCAHRKPPVCGAPCVTHQPLQHSSDKKRGPLKTNTETSFPGEAQIEEPGS
jgi:hypothetical protein